MIVGRGFIAGKFRDAFSLLPELDRPELKCSSVDITDESQVKTVMIEDKPDILINCAGKTGRPNIDWCELPENKAMTWASNVYGPILLAKECLKHDVFLVHIGSGCIYEGDNGGAGFSEDDSPNFTGSFYSRTKIEAERQLDFLWRNVGLKVLQLRLRMPVDGVPSERNLITKITQYKRIISIPNSVSVLDDFLAAAMVLIKKRALGIFNVTNPGFITHKEVLEMYREIVDPSHEYDLISLAQLDSMTRARRSNCILNTKKVDGELEGTGARMREVHVAVRDCLEKYKGLLKKS